MQESFRTNNDIDTPALIVTYGGDSCVQSSGTDSVAGRPDGAEEDVGTGAMYLTSSDYEVWRLFPSTQYLRFVASDKACWSQIMHDGGEQVVGITFPSVNIPQGDIVTSAYVLFDVDEVRPGQSDATTSVSIYGEANTASAAPTTTANDLSNRVPTASNVMWQPEPSVGVHDDLTTPDISVVVNEIVSLPGWAAGNTMTILFGHTTGSGTRWVVRQSP